MKPLNKIRQLINDAAIFRKALATSEVLRQPGEGISQLFEHPGRVADMVISRNGEPYLGVGYAFRAALLSLGKAEEMMDACGKMWPALGDKVARLRRRGTIDYFWRRLKKTAGISVVTDDEARCAPEQFHQYTDDAMGISSPPVEILRAFEMQKQPINRESPSTQDLGPDIAGYYHALCQYRDHRVVGRLLGHKKSPSSRQGPEMDYSLFPPRESDWPELEAMLRNYRRSNLLFSWIRYANGDHARNRYPLLFDLVREKTMLSDYLGEIAADFQLRDGERENFQSILNRLHRALPEVGYPHLVDCVFSEGGQDGPDSMLGNTRPINLIPSRHKGACCPILLAFVQGRNRRSTLGFASTMRKVKTHLIECSGVTRAVIVVTDNWDSEEFLTEHFAELAAHYRKGVRFLFLLAGEAPVALSPIGIDFRKAA